MRRYIQIFGDKHHPGNPMVADTILCDFVRKFPTKKAAGGGHNRTKRGNINYLHESGKSVLRGT
jgi:hypothetical protein